MPTQKFFKRRIRARMTKTGESGGTEAILGAYDSFWLTLLALARREQT